jgi:octaprenyl-diphosphate synthase
MRSAVTSTYRLKHITCTDCRNAKHMLENLPYFQKHLPEDLSRVDAVINRAVESEVVLISQIGQYIISAGGKRLRPIITILAGKALSYNEDPLFSLAAMVEFIHTSTLLHDDVVDESDLRRGRETANNLFGNAAAVLVGDFLYTRAFQLMVGSGSLRILEVMAEATNIIAEGEVMQLMNIGNIDITEEQYIQVIEYKTAKLFQAAAQVGAILARATEKQELALKNYGTYLGTAFQIIDDVLDYAGDVDTIGKNVGDDLAEGKPTLPLIYLLNQGSPAAAADVRHALEHADRSYFDKIHDHVIHSDALAYCTAQAKKAVDAAVNCLNDLPDNEATQAMRDLALASLARIS